MRDCRIPPPALLTAEQGGKRALNSAAPRGGCRQGEPSSSSSSSRLAPARDSCGGRGASAAFQGQPRLQRAERRGWFPVCPGRKGAAAGRRERLPRSRAEPGRAWPPPLTGAGSQTPELGAGTFGAPGPLRPGPFRPLLGQSRYSVPWGPRPFRARARWASPSPLAARLRFLKNP